MPNGGWLRVREAVNLVNGSTLAGLGVAAAASWVLTGDFGARNTFERRAGLADGGYTDRPLRPAFRRVLKRRVSGSGPPAGPLPRSDPGPAAGTRGESTASPSR